MIKFRIDRRAAAWKLATSCLAATLLFAGCGDADSVVAIANALDAQIEQQWLADRESVDAIQFIEEGGVYEDVLPDATIDTEHVLPLVTSLRDEFGLSPQAVLTAEQFAMALIVEVPADPAQRKRIAERIQAADDEFDGVVADHWGQRWLSLDWFNEQEVAMFESSGVLEEIVSHHAAMRENP